MMTGREPLIIMLGSAGAGAALELSGMKKNDLQKHFPRHFRKGEQELFREQEVLTSLFSNTENIEWKELYVSFQGEGVFSCLWRLAEQRDTGLVVDLYSIPIHQYTVELCERYEKNPYTETAGAGGLVITHTLDEVLALGKKLEIPVAVIGHLQEGKDRIIKNNDTIRFLTP